MNWEPRFQTFLFVGDIVVKFIKHKLTSVACASIALLALGLSGCSKESKWEGVYVNANDKGELELKPEHKGTLKMGNVSTSELTWEIKGDDKIVVNVPYPIEMFKIPGGLRDQQGAEWKKK